MSGGGPILVSRPVALPPQNTYRVGYGLAAVTRSVSQCKKPRPKNQVGFPFEGCNEKGGGDLKLIMMSKSEELIDPDTGISLGSDDTEIGAVCVSQAHEKFSIAEFVSITGIVKGGGIAGQGAGSADLCQSQSAFFAPGWGWHCGFFRLFGYLKSHIT